MDAIREKLSTVWSGVVHFGQQLRASSTLTKVWVGVFCLVLLVVVVLAAMTLYVAGTSLFAHFQRHLNNIPQSLALAGMSLQALNEKNTAILLQKRRAFPTPVMQSVQDAIGNALNFIAGGLGLAAVVAFSLMGVLAQQNQKGQFIVRTTTWKQLVGTAVTEVFGPDNSPAVQPKSETDVATYFEDKQFAQQIQNVEVLAQKFLQPEIDKGTPIGKAAFKGFINYLNTVKDAKDLSDDVIRANLDRQIKSQGENVQDPIDFKPGGVAGYAKALLNAAEK